MKNKLYFFLIGILFICSHNSYSQSPEAFNYQAAIRNTNGELVAGQSVNVRASINDITASGTTLYRESHTLTTTELGMINIQIGKGTSDMGDFSNIDWGTNLKFLKIEVDLGNDYISIGTTQMLSVPYALYADVATTAEVLGTQGVYSTKSDTLFVVKDHDGNVVFAVFPDGAEVIVNETAKGKVGGFAVSGRSPTKADFGILKVTTDSTRIFVTDTLKGKGKVGGFAISGRSPTKGTVSDYLKVNNDSTVIFINNDPAKGKVGGFAISGRSPTKGLADYFNVSGESNPIIINPSEPRVVWFPRKEAFWAGRVLIEHPDSVGYNSLAVGYEAVAKGSNSQSLGYQTRARGNFSTAIGYKTQANGTACFAVGGEEYGADGVATGNHTIADGIASFALGLGANASGIANTSIGLRSSATGEFASTALGVFAQATETRATAIGFGTVASGEQSMAIGVADTATAMNSLAMGVGSKASGIAAVALGNFVEANTVGSFVVGQLNDTIGTDELWNFADPLFVVGNGIFTGTPGDLSNVIRNNALVILKNGNMGIGVNNPQRKVHIKDVMRLEPGTAPVTPAEGDMYYDAALHKLLVFDGTIWQACW